MRWTVAVAAFFAVVFAMNAVLIWVAVSGAEPIDPTYATEGR